VIQDILALREKGFSFRKIAKELGTTVGKVQYRFQKHQEEAGGEKAVQPPKVVQPPIVSVEEIRPLAASYDRDEITLLPRGPSSLYAFWETREITRRLIEHQFRTPWHELTKVLRLYDVTAILFNGHNAHRFVDMEIPEMTNNWYFHGLEENRTFIVDIGVKTSEHHFFSVIRSNPIDTPRIKESMKGHYQEAVQKWQEGLAREPEWLEHFSTYSYYESTK
jgi:uncharacterized protein